MREKICRIMACMILLCSVIVFLPKFSMRVEATSEVAQLETTVTIEDGEVPLTAGSELETAAVTEVSEQEVQESDAEGDGSIMILLGGIMLLIIAVVVIVVASVAGSTIVIEKL